MSKQKILKEKKELLAELQKKNVEVVDLSDGHNYEDINTDIKNGKYKNAITMANIDSSIKADYFYY
jgi:hypothetical protein